MRKQILFCALLPLLLLAQVWRENFDVLDASETAASGKWHLGKNAEMKKGNGAYEVICKEGTPRIARNIPYLGGKPISARYLQIRLFDGSGRILQHFNNQLLLDWMMVRPGLFTFPIGDNARTGNGASVYSVYFNGNYRFGELALVNEDAVDGVFVTVMDPSGKLKAASDTAVAGDIVNIEMQLKDKSDNLS